MHIPDKALHWNGEQVKKEEAVRTKKQETDTGKKESRMKGELSWEPEAG